jgi:hypothetical protein
MSPTRLQILAHQVAVPIAGLSAEKIAEIKASPQAQLRTAKFKKAVYILDDLVLKGPYKSEDQGLMKNLRYTYAMELLETVLRLHEWERGSLRWKFLGCGADGQHYLAAPNVGRQENIPFKVESSELEMHVKVVPRGEIVKRVSEIEATGRLADNIKSASLQHLYFRFLLDIGDSGTHNVLLREDYHGSGRLIAGIDLEETRGAKEKQRRLDHLFKKGPSKRQIDLYGSDVSKIKSLAFGQLDRQTIDRLRAVGIDLERLQANMKLWNRLK